MNRFVRSLGVLLLAGVLIAGLPGGSASAEMSGTCGDSLVWSMDGGVLTISGTGDMYSFIERTPEWSRYILTNVVIEPGVTGIGALAFDKYSFLESVEIPGTVTSIGDYAFADCASLESVTIPDSVTEIGINPFAGCDALKEIVLSENHPVFTVRDGMLIRREDGLLICRAASYPGSSCAVPEGTRVIGEYAFAGCSALRTLEVPEGVEQIGREAFSGSGLLGKINLPAGIVSVGDHAFDGCEYLTGVIFGEGLEGIGAGAFTGCIRLRELSFPVSLKILGNNPFEGCTALSEIRVGPDHPYLETADGMLITKTDRKLVFYMALNSAESCEIPKDTRIIGEHAFGNGRNLREIALPHTVREIESRAFDGCVKVREIRFRPGPERIGREAFANMAALEEIVLPESLAVIGDYAFAGCTHLRRITIPAGVTDIGSELFAGADTLNLVVFAAGGSAAEAYCLDNDLRTALPGEEIPEETVKMPYAFTDAYPGYTGLYRMDTGNENEAVFLARTPGDVLVLLCGTERPEDGWTIIESASLPAESMVVMYEGQEMLDTGSAHCVVRRYYGDVWGIAFTGKMRNAFGPKWIMDCETETREFGVHPWGDLRTIDWITLDDDIRELRKTLDASVYATPVRGNPDGRTPLYSAPDGSRTVAALVSGAPLFVLEKGGEWTHVCLGRDGGEGLRVDGWVRTEDLAFGEEAHGVSIDYRVYPLYARSGDTIILETPLGEERFPGSEFDAWLWLTAGEASDGGKTCWLVYNVNTDEAGFVPKDLLHPPQG